MSFRSQVLYWSPQDEAPEKAMITLQKQGVNLISLPAGETLLDPRAAAEASALVLDLSAPGAPQDADVRQLLRLARDHGLRLLCLARDHDAIAGLSALDDDHVQFLVGPALDQQLAARLRVLCRVEAMEEEILRRANTSLAFGIDAPYDTAKPHETVSRILLVGSPSKDFAQIERTIASDRHILVGAYTPQMAFEFLETGDFDLILFNADPNRDATLDFIHQVRLDATFFHTPIVVLGEPDDIGDPLDVYLSGANEVTFKPIQDDALLFQVRTHIREHRYHRHLAALYETARKEGIIDPATGLFTYGFLMDHLNTVVESLEDTDLALTIACFNIQNLSALNRKHGYAAGDALIRQIGSLIGQIFRQEDLTAHIRGGEFMAILPRTRAEEAARAIKRLVSTVNTTKFQLKPAMAAANYHLTFGQAVYELGDTAETLFERARKLAHRKSAA